MKKIVFALAMAGACMPVAAHAQGEYEETDDYVTGAEYKSGFRVEGRAFYESITDPADIEYRGIYYYETGETYDFGSGVGLGFEVGYDFPVGENVTVGPYFTYDFSNLETCEDGVCFEAPEYWATGLQVGLASGDTGLLYGKLGYGQQTVALTGTLDDPDFGIITFDERESFGGYNFAFGYEHGFSETIYARGELGISGSNDVYGFDLQRVIFGISAGARF